MKKTRIYPGGEVIFGPPDDNVKDKTEYTSIPEARK